MFGSLILIQTSTKRRTETQEQTFYTSSSMLAISGKKMKKKVSDAIISWKLKQEWDGYEKKSVFYFYLLHLRLISSLELFLKRVAYPYSILDYLRSLIQSVDYTFYKHEVLWFCNFTGIMSLCRSGCRWAYLRSYKN